VSRGEDVRQEHGPGGFAHGERLQKVLARAGVGSRRAVEDLIRSRRVKVNGSVARLGQRIDQSKDSVEIDGSFVPLGSHLVYYLLNKPAGVLSSAVDTQKRPTVTELVDVDRRVWPVGRLDMDTEGALILTNDGDMTFCLTHPSHAVPKTYVAYVQGSFSGTAMATLRRGVPLEDGVTQPARARVVERAGGRSLVELTIAEGRNRQVRRMFEVVGYPIYRLVRTAIGPLGLGRLKPGGFRRLAPEEVRALFALCHPSRQNHA
jgi:23S rRNA pseudouridine2605 synthase